MNYNQMNTGFEFMGNPILPGQQIANNVQNQPAYPVYTKPEELPSYEINKALNDSPKVEQPKKKGLFTVIPDGQDMPNILDSDTAVQGKIAEAKKKTTRAKKEPVAKVNGSEIVRADDNKEAQELSTMYNYAQTVSLLGQTLDQVDMIAGELKDEFDAAKNNRTLKNKHNYIIGLAESMGQLLNTKAAIIREINNSITKSVELDYKKEKDRMAIAGAANDDKYLMDLYNAFITNPTNAQSSKLMGPSAINSSISTIDGNSIVRSPLAAANPAPDGITDIGYLNYLSRITPEQNMMAYEKDPNVKTVVVYDASNGQKFFQVMNLATGQVVPNVPVLDNRFLDDTVIDISNNIAKNNNLRETYPLVVINGAADGNNAVYKNY